MDNVIVYDLNALVKTYSVDSDYSQYKRLEFLSKLKSYIEINNKTTVLELGSASGQMTELISKVVGRVVAVDGSTDFIEIAKKRVGDKPTVIFCSSYFEDFTTNEKFDCIIMFYILEHVENPTIILDRMKNYLSDDGFIAIAVPNSYALSRQLAVKMGILHSVYELTPNDLGHGHYRTYDWDMLIEQINASGLEIVGKHGLSFKLFSDRQNVEMLNANIIGEAQITGLWQLGDEYPELSGGLMAVARLKK